MWITAYTDASFCKGKGGWSIWLRSERGRIVRSGECPDNITDSGQAELYAAYQAVRYADATWDNIEGIFLNSDNLTVVKSLFPWSKAINNKHMRDIQETIRKLLKATGFRLRTKHIKGHGAGKDVRSYLNNQCDRLAGLRARANAD